MTSGNENRVWEWGAWKGYPKRMIYPLSEIEVFIPYNIIDNPNTKRN